MDLPSITLSNIPILILLFIIVVYIFQDVIKPYISRGNGSLEGFLSGSLNPGITSSGKGIINSLWYVEDHEKPIGLNNGISLPIIRYGYYAKGSYDDLVGQYFRHRIYPIEPLPISTGLETLYQFINNDIDIAFLNEELLARYINRDCKYLTRLIAENLGLGNDIDLSQKDIIDKLYPPINFSAIGVGYHQNFYLIVNNFSNIIEFLDIQGNQSGQGIPSGQGKRIGVLEDSYYIFWKLVSAYGLDIESLKPTITRVNNLEDLIRDFQGNKYDGIFVVIHPKNKQIVRMTRNIKCRYIHIQKRQGLDTRKNLERLIPDQQGSGNGSQTESAPPDINRQAIYSKAVMDDLKTENITETFNDLMRKYFLHARPMTVDLNKFHKSGNLYTYLETYSTRMILIIRNDIPEKRVEYLTRNYINELARMRDTIDREAFVPQLENFSSQEFDYNELVSFSPVIPLATGARKVYTEEGLVKFADEDVCRN